MRTPRLFALAASLALGGPVLAQHDQRPYAGLETRAIKALSDEQMADLRAGRGMGLALAAELNGYPGPRHVLELAESLNLSPAQRARIEALRVAMTAETASLGETLIAQERELDRLFAERTITPAALSAGTRAIGATQARLRHAHLQAHLSTIAVLTAGQVHRYGQLRGYEPGGHGTPDGHAHKP